MIQIPDFNNAELKAANKEQFGTGKKCFDDLIDCRVTTLQAQADHEPERNKFKDLNL